MDIDYIKQMSPAERLELLRADAMEIIENTTYTKPLTEAEVAFYKDELSEKSILQFEMMEQKKDADKAFKDRLTPVQNAIRKALKATKFRMIECQGTLFKIAEFDTKMVHTIDHDGNLINSRPMLPNERQMRIQPLKQESA